MKKRELERIPNHPNIYWIRYRDLDTNKLEYPVRGKKFYATRRSYDGNGRMRRVSGVFQSFDQAKEFARGGKLPARKEVKISVDKDLSPNESIFTFFDLLQSWTTGWLPQKARSTQIRYRSYLQHFRFFERMPVKEIDAVVIDQWIASIKAPEYLIRFHTTRCDYEHEYSVLRRILNYYKSRFDRNYGLPFTDDHKSMLKVKEKPIIDKDLDVDEFKRFISSLKGIVEGTKWEVILWLALMQYGSYTRVQEAAALHCEDFDFGRNKLTINKKVIWPRERNSSPYLDVGSKANGGKILSPIPELAIKVCREWKMKSGIRAGLLFPFDGQLLNYRQIQERYDQAAKLAGLPFRGTHILRHASLTEYYDVCNDILATQKMAGHRDMKSTSRYAKVRDKKLKTNQVLMDERTQSLAQGLF